VAIFFDKLDHFHYNLLPVLNRVSLNIT